MNKKQTRAKYTLEFKQEAVRQVKAGRAASVVAATLGMPKASLTNWVRADAKCQAAGVPEDKAQAKAPAVTPEQAEIARLRAQVARLTMERDIAKKAALDSTRHCNTFGTRLQRGGNLWLDWDVPDCLMRRGANCGSDGKREIPSVTSVVRCSKILGRCMEFSRWQEVSTDQRVNEQLRRCRHMIASRSLAA